MTTAATLPPVGEWLGRSFRLAFARWTTLFLLGAVSWLLSAVIVVVLFAGVIATIGLVHGWDMLPRLVDPEDVYAASGDPTLGLMFQAVGFLAAFLVLRITTTYLLAMTHATLDGTSGFRESLRRAKRRSYRFLGMVLLHQIGIMLASLLLIVPGILLAIWWSVAPQVFAAEDLGIRATLGRSRALVRGRWWGVFGRTLLLSLVASAVMIVPIAGWVLGPCLALCGMAELYRDLSAGAAAAS